jgi:lipid-A-disaccharide synthase
VVPERVQEEATADNLAADALAWFDDEARRNAAIATFRAMHLSLRQDASLRIAAALAPYLEAGR